ncbi:MAG TPA: radical SAM protein [Candidatus Saccharimonadales bacterium]|nr:radical SAM protein [Candidatus Saccharimonadales bacterium]
MAAQQREREPRPLLHAAGVVILEGDKVLLVRHKNPPPGTSGNLPGMYGLPSGIKRSPFQSLEDSGAGFTREETGIETHPEDLFPIPGINLRPALIKRTDGNVLEVLMHAYLHVGAQHVRPLEETSTTITEWVSQEELQRLEEEGQLLPNVKRVVENARKYKEQLDISDKATAVWVYRSDSPALAHDGIGYHQLSELPDFQERGMEAILNRKGKGIVANFEPLSPEVEAQLADPTDIYTYSIIDGAKVPDTLPASRKPKVDWWITEFCNYTCDFCWVDTIDIAGSRAQQDAGWKSMLAMRRPIREKVAKAIADSDAEDVTLCGGEPLLVDPLEINSYGRMWREKGKKLTINTNASLLKRYFSELDKHGEEPEVDRIKISIDGADEEGVKDMRGRNASYKAIEEGVILAQAHGIEVVLTTMVSGRNMNNLPRIAEVIRELEPDSWRLLEHSDRENDAKAKDRHKMKRSNFEFWAGWAPDHVAPIPVFASDNDLNAGCFIIDQLGNRQIPSGDSYREGPNCLEVPINRIWEEDPETTEIIILNKSWLDKAKASYLSREEYIEQITYVSPEIHKYNRNLFRREKPKMKAGINYTGPAVIGTERRELYPPLNLN